MSRVVNPGRRSLLSSIVAGAGAAVFGSSDAHAQSVAATPKANLGYTPVRTLNGSILAFRNEKRRKRISPGRRRN